MMEEEDGLGTRGENELKWERGRETEEGERDRERDQRWKLKGDDVINVAVL